MKYKNRSTTNTIKIQFLILLRILKINLRLILMVILVKDIFTIKNK